MKVSVDTKERIIISALFLLEVYKILMGTCLTIFVPRMCGSVVCEISDAVVQEGTFHRIAMGFNAYSLLAMFALYFVELRRENWCIKYLDIDESKPAIALDHEIETYPAIKKDMTIVNRRYKSVVLFVSASQLVNIGISIADLAMHWAGITSLTPLASYIILLALKLFYSAQTASASLKQERAYSSYMRIQKSYNTIDVDHRLTTV